MAKFILGVTFALSLLGYATTASVSAEHIVSVPTPTTSVRRPRKKSNHHHFNVGRVITSPLRYLTGWASYYGPGFQGARTALGKRFDTNTLSCAMRWVPLYTWVTVLNLNNGRTVRCQILDRGPFVAGRIIDLSVAAKVALSMDGLAPVKVIY